MFQDDEFWDYDVCHISKLTSMGLGTLEYRAQGCCFLSGQTPIYISRSQNLLARRMRIRGCK